MSIFLGQATGFNVLLESTDCDAVGKLFAWDFIGGAVCTRPWDDGMLWGKSRMGADNSAGMLFNVDNQSSGRYEPDVVDVFGGQQMLKLRGVTRDSTGAPLGSCIVQGFVTATDAYVGQCTSDSGGYYELPTSHAGAQHYIVAYRAGSPDVAGTSVNTLTPS